LVWLHLVGDVHQPLHASTRVSSTALQGDNGGNDEKVADAQITIEAWRVDYNNVRPHSALGGATPAHFAATSMGEGAGKGPGTGIMLTATRH